MSLRNVQPLSLRDGQGRDIGQVIREWSRQDLNAYWQVALALDCLSNDGHSCDDLGADLTAQVRHIVHVLNGDSVHTRVAIEPGLTHRQVNKGVDGEGCRRRPWKRARVKHADESARRA